MTERLQAALAEIADHAPVAQVPDDTYRRGRRSRRNRIAAGTLALVLACLGVGSAVQTTAHDDPPIANQRDTGAVPSQLYGVPERLTMTDGHGRWTGPVETDLAIGTGSVAWETSVGGPPVVVTAADGAYHLLQLPGFVGNDFGWSGLGPALAISPDGRFLAYAWSAGTLGSSSGSSGVRVVDLETGDLRTVPLPSTGLGTLVQQLTWSPDSRWLAWYGGTVVSSNGLHGTVRGLIAPAATDSTSLPSPRDAATTMAVDVHGRVALATSNHTLLVSPSGAVSRAHASLPRPISLMGEPLRASFSPDARYLSLPTTGRGGVSTIDLASGRELTHLFPGGLYPDRATVQPLGWVDDDRFLVEVMPDNGAPELAVTTPTTNRTSTFRIVTRTDGRVPATLSVAVDLMTPDRYTEDLPAPDWPWSTERKILVALAVAAGIWLAIRFTVGLVRRPRYPARR